MNTMCNPTVFVIPQELWAPNHNFGIYSGWYNECFYAWEHRQVPNNTRSRYQLFCSYSTFISTLTQWHIDFHKSVVACQKITWDENSSFLYLRKNDYGFLHFPSCYTWFTYFLRVVTTLNMLSRKIWNILFVLFYHYKISFYAKFQVPTYPSRATFKDTSPRFLANINIYLCVLRQYSTYSRRRGSVVYPNQDSVLVYREIPLSKSQMVFLG